jgi:hypothetical protein
MLSSDNRVELVCDEKDKYDLDQYGCDCAHAGLVRFLALEGQLDLFTEDILLSHHMKELLRAPFLLSAGNRLDKTSPVLLVSK